VLVGVIDVASDKVETPAEVAATIRSALKYVPKNRLIACTNCGMAPMNRALAVAKLEALAAGAALARKKVGKSTAKTTPRRAAKPRRAKRAPR